MGESLSIDERCSELEDILHVDLEQLKEGVCEIDSSSSNISQNIKIWRFYEETTGKSKKKKKKTLSQPITLDKLQSKDFSFLAAECYVVLLVYRRNHTTPLFNNNSNSSNILPSLSEIIMKSYDNLTPRGLETPLSRSELNIDGVDSVFLSSQNVENEDIKQQNYPERISYEHMILVWNGKECNPLVKSLGLSSAYSLESIIGQGQDKLLKELFNGRVINPRDRLQNKEIINTTTKQLGEDVKQYGVVPLHLEKIQQINNTELESTIGKMSQNIFLVRFLCSESITKKGFQQGQQQNNIDQLYNSKSLDNQNNINQYDLQQKGQNLSQRLSQMQSKQLHDQTVENVYKDKGDDDETSTHFGFFKRLFCQGIDSVVQNNNTPQQSLGFQIPTEEQIIYTQQNQYFNNFTRIPGTILKNKQKSPKSSMFAKQSQEYQQKQQQQQFQIVQESQQQQQQQQQNTIVKQNVVPASQGKKSILSMKPLNLAGLGGGQPKTDVLVQQKNEEQSEDINNNYIEDIQNAQQLDNKLDDIQGNSSNQIVSNEQIPQNIEYNDNSNTEDIHDAINTNNINGDNNDQSEQEEFNDTVRDFYNEDPSAGVFLENTGNNEKTNNEQQQQIGQDLEVFDNSNSNQQENQDQQSEQLFMNPFNYNPSDEINGWLLDTSLKIKYFAQICSAVIPELLYVGGEIVAYNKQLLNSNGITHIINCAGDVCKNMFPDDFIYRVYRLKDTKTENIEAIFYETIQFIEEVKKQNGRVFIHCVQGISRSVTLCIAYVIWKEKIDFQEALTFVKKGRDIASPNVGFLVQLINFYKRLYQPFDSISVKPRVWCVCSHQVEQPNLIAAKMLLEGLYPASNHMNTNKLDPRGVFIIESAEKLYLWVGSQIPPERCQVYIDYAIKYIDNLRKYEHAPNNTLEIIKETQESKEFWSMWQSLPEQPYGKVKEWDNWFLDLVDPSLPELPPQYYYDLDGNTEVENQKNQLDYQNQEERNFKENTMIPLMKPILFIYPDSTEPLNMFDFDDLQEDNLCILCRLQDGVVKVHIWRGLEFTQSLEAEQQFLDDIIQNNFGEQDVNKIFIFKESPSQESDEFNECFQAC